MTRKPRFDAPGWLHHVINRGQNGMNVFRRPEDFRFFTTLLAVAARQCRIGIHVYVLLDNHFHLLIKSLDGDLSETMRRVLGRYAAYFNSVYGHTGHVFQARFSSFPVRSLTYLLRLVRYIDRNPVKAGLVKDPLTYKHGSAVRHVASRRSPLWLDRSVVNPFLEPALAAGEELAQAYRRAFRLDDTRDRSRMLIEARLTACPQERDDLDMLCEADAATWAEWFAERTIVSTGTLPSLPMADAASVLETLDEHPDIGLVAPLRRPSGRPLDTRNVLEVGLLRELGGLGHRQVAATLGITMTVAVRRAQDHREAVASAPEYLQLLADAGRQALARCLGPTPADAGGIGGV